MHGSVRLSVAYNQRNRHHRMGLEKTTAMCLAERDTARRLEEIWLNGDALYRGPADPDDLGAALDHSGAGEDVADTAALLLDTQVRYIRQTALRKTVRKGRKPNCFAEEHWVGGG